MGRLAPDTRWWLPAILAGLACLAGCSSGLGLGGSGQSSMPAGIVVGFKAGVLPHQATAEVRRCHPLAIMGTDTVRNHGNSAVSVLIWGPQSGTAGASALFNCLKAAPGVTDQNWTG